METRRDLPDKPVIAIDIDDVIAANAAGFVSWSNEKFGTHLTPDDYQEHWGEVWKIELEETLKRALEFHENGPVGSYGIIEGACDALQKLHKRFKLIAITSRRNSINQLTREWIEKYYPGIFDDIVFPGFFDTISKEDSHKRLSMTKGEVAKNLGAQYFIDDQLKHVTAAAALGIKTLLFGEYAWNKVDALPENVTRVKDWKEVLTYFGDA